MISRSKLLCLLGAVLLLLLVWSSPAVSPAAPALGGAFGSAVGSWATLGSPKGARNAPSAPSAPSAPAPAKDVDAVQQHTQAVLQHAREGDWAKAAEVTRALEAGLAARAPLEIVDIQVLGGPPQGLGMYTPLFKGQVRGEEVFIYAQVRNHGLREVHGHYELHLATQLVILGEQGKELAREDNFGESRFSARTPHRDTFVVLALRTKGLATGTYRARVTLRDKVGEKQATEEVTFSIR